MKISVKKALKKSHTQVVPKSPRSPTEIDHVIAKNICLIRNARGVTQKALAKELGITFQQIQKYENVKNRIAASRLFQMADVLRVSIQDFFPEGSSLSPSFSQDYLTTENVEILTLIHKLPGDERKNIAKNILRTLTS